MTTAQAIHELTQAITVFGVLFFLMGSAFFGVYLARR